MMPSSDDTINSTGLSRALIERISHEHNEPGWMTEFRLKALELFERLPMPTWGVDLSHLDLTSLQYYVRPAEQQWNSWEQVPDAIKQRFERIGVPQAERAFLAGVGAQYESEMIYNNLKLEWEARGVVLLATSSGLREHEQLFKKYFATVVPPHDNKFAALNSALWSGGNFLYVPQGVQVALPVQAYFLMNTPSMGQFERTLIIAQAGSSVHYVEGCSAPVYQRGSLHSGVVEVIALPGSRVRYTTIQNWSTDVYNLVTKRAIAHEKATVEWIDGNFGSRCTMKYPSVILQGEGAHGQMISVAVAGAGQHHDTGGMMIHRAPRTTSHILSKSLCKENGVCTYRGKIQVDAQATEVRAHVQCDSLLLSDTACTFARPTVTVAASDAQVGHEASVSSLDQEQLLYVQSRGLSMSRARALMVNGFIDAFVQELPMEYAVEINRLIAFEIVGQ
jgi:Fe-S cluster assembly protein SufB